MGITYSFSCCFFFFILCKICAIYTFYEHLGCKFFGIKKMLMNKIDFQRRPFKFVLSSSIKTQQKQTKNPHQNPDVSFSFHGNCKFGK